MSFVLCKLSRSPPSALQKSSDSCQVFFSWEDFLKIFVVGKKKKIFHRFGHLHTRPGFGNCCLTLKQVFLSIMGVQPDAQLRGSVVGGTVVTFVPSAGFLQMYFSLLSQLTTSHSPANTPVVMATHPCFLSFIKHGKVNVMYRT